MGRLIHPTDIYESVSNFTWGAIIGVNIF